MIAKEFSTNATSFSGSTQNEGNKKLVELSLQAFTSSIMPAVGVYYLYTVLKDDTDTKVKSNDSLIKANKEMVEKEINANKELIQANKELIQANKEMVEMEINANKEMVEKEIKAIKEMSVEMIKAYGANIENLILKKG